MHTVEQLESVHERRRLTCALESFIFVQSLLNFFPEVFKTKVAILRLSMWPSVVAVAILLLLFCLFSIIFYCKRTAQASAATLWNNWLVQYQVNTHLRPAQTK